MKSEDEVLNVVICRFPNHNYFINELFEVSESFQTLCEDYCDCKMMLDKLIDNSNKENDIRQEYQILLTEIEGELLENITR